MIGCTRSASKLSAAATRRLKSSRETACGIFFLSTEGSSSTCIGMAASTR
jgi:hypothetical protein